MTHNATFFLSRAAMKPMPTAKPTKSTTQKIRLAISETPHCRGYLRCPSGLMISPLVENMTGKAYSTVTLLARLRGWSTSVPLSTAT